MEADVLVNNTNEAALARTREITLALNKRLEIRQPSIPHIAHQGDFRIILLKQAEQEETNIHHHHRHQVITKPRGNRVP